MAEVDYYNQIRFVDDHPSSTDEFRGQPHKSVADILVSILTSGEGGRAIGLEGTWGSGKSTVVDIAQSILQSRDADIDEGKKYTFFVYGAWAHQSDPLRRVFLQELIQCLDANDSIDKAHWIEKLEKLETRRKKVVENKAEQLSLVAKSSIITVPFLPIAYLLLNNSNSSFEFPLPIIGCVSIPYGLIGISIISIPFIIAAITLLTWREGWRSSWKFLSSSWWLTKEEMRGKSVIWAFTRHTDHITTEQFIREEEATTVEFNAIFDELINDAAEHDHQIIIVFDNLDRLPPDLIRTAWATMRNFFATTPGTSRQSTLKNVWLIVPFDRVHIEEVFGKGEEDEKGGATPGFVEKTFEIVLRVAPPILSNWREFLSTKLKGSFGETISEAEMYQIFRVFDLYQRLHAKTITPRTIKSFINTVVAQAKQWGKLIPLEHQALYALYKDDISSNISKLQDSTIFEETVQTEIANPDWAKSLAAAHYNVNPEDALEILLTPEIGIAISKNDIDRLTELQKTGGFSLVLGDYISQSALQWAKQTPAIFFDVADTFNNLSLNDDVVVDDIWRKMVSQVASIDKAFRPNERTAGGLQALIKHSSPDRKTDTARKLVRALSSYNDTKVPDSPETTGKTWYSLFEAIAEELEKEVGDSTPKGVFSAIRIPGNINTLLDVAATAGDAGKIPFSAFKVSISPEDITTEVVAFIERVSPDQKLDPIIRAFTDNPTTIDWERIVTAIRVRLQGPTPPLTTVDAHRLLTLCTTIGKTEDTAIAAMNTLDNDGSLHGLLGLALSKTHPPLVALTLHELMIHRSGQLNGPDNNPHYGDLAAVNTFISQIQSSPDDEMLIRELAQHAGDEHRFNHILKSGLSEDGYCEIYRAILRQMVALGTIKILAPLMVLGNMTRISEILEPDFFIQFLEQFGDWNIRDSISGDKWTKIDPQFLVLSHPLSTENYRTAIDNVRSGLAAFTTERWCQSLKEEDNALRLLFTIVDLGEPPELKVMFFDAIKSHTQSLIEGAEMPISFREKWPALTKLLPPARRTQLYKWLRDKLIDKGPTAEFLRQILTLFGTDFSTNADFSAKAEDIIRVVIDPILAEGTVESMACLDAHAQAFAKTLNFASDAEKQGLSDRLTTQYEAGDADMKRKVDSLAIALELTIDRAEPPSEPDQSQSETPSTSDSSESTD